jgi:hypothetical protein
MATGSPEAIIEFPCPLFGYTSCTQNFGYLQFDPRILEIEGLTVPTIILSDRPAFPYLRSSFVL